MVVTASVTGNYPNNTWLSINPDSVSVAAGQSFEFQVQIAPDTSFSQNWDYFGIIHLQTNACPDSEIPVAVVVYVLDTPKTPDGLPRVIALHDIYPNPFNLTAIGRFDLPQAQLTTIEMYDVTGRLVKSLVNGRFPAGVHTFSIDASNLASGLYWVGMRAGAVRLTRKALLLK